MKHRTAILAPVTDFPMPIQGQGFKIIASSMIGFKAFRAIPAHQVFGFNGQMAMPTTQPMGLGLDGGDIQVGTPWHSRKG
jgi:hypothetical protein